MKRISAIEAIALELADELVICNLGYPSRELYALKDKVTHFYMLGSMGLASSIGLGLAMAQPRKVVVLDGDGSLLMNLGSLATIANHAPENYLLVVLDNQCYGSTGCQLTATSHAADLAAIATGAETSWQSAQRGFYVRLVLMYLVWAVGTSGMNAGCSLRSRTGFENVVHRHWT